MKLIVESGEAIGGPSGANYQTYEDEGRTPEIYVDGVHGIQIAGSIVRINFVTRGFNPPANKSGDVEVRRVACRTVMSVETFQAVAALLAQVGAEMSSRLADATEEAAPDA